MGAIEQSTVERVGVTPAGHVSHTEAAQVRRRRHLEAGLARGQPDDLPRDGDVVAPELSIPLEAHRLHHCPDLQGAEFARELRAQVGDPDRSLEVRVLFERQVLRAMREHRSERGRVAYQGGARFIGDIQPLVRIHRDGISALHATIQGGELG